MGISDFLSEVDPLSMPTIRRHSVFVKLGLFALLTLVSCTLPAQSKSSDDPETAALRKQALDLYRAGKFVEALPLLEKLSGANPQDYVVKEHWAYSVLEY